MLCAITFVTLFMPTKSFRPHILSNHQQSRYDSSSSYSSSCSSPISWKCSHIHRKQQKRQHYHTKLTMSTSSSSSRAPITFKSFEVSNRKLLARSDASDILNVLKEWSASDRSDEGKINSWVEQGLAIWLDDDTLDNSIELVSNAIEKGSEDVAKKSYVSYIPSTMDGDSLLYDDDNCEGAIVGLPNRQYTTADVYINLGDDKDNKLRLLKASKAQLAPKLSTNERIIRGLVERGEIFNDLEWFLQDRNMTRKGDEIALRLKTDYSIDSKEWKLWTSKTEKYNATSLTQVFGEYFRDYSAGDNGGVDVSDANYISKPGYPGTLAPGTEFKQDADIKDLPNYILHPWPAMQEIKAHGRNPPAHPMIPPPLLWFAMNDMYTQNFTDWQLKESSAETIGGYMMEPKDAIRIAKYHKIYIL